MKFRAPEQFAGLAIADIDAKGRRLLTVDRNLASLWSLSNGRLLDVLGGHAAPILDAAFSDDGSRIVTGAADGETIVWDAFSGNALATLHASRPPPATRPRSRTSSSGPAGDSS